MKASLLAAGLMVAGALFIPAGAASAAQAKTMAKGTHAAKSAAATSQKASASGTVEKYDSASRTLVLKHDGKETSFVLADSTSIMAGKEKAALTDLTAGRKAKVEYTVANGAKTVQMVELEKSASHTAKPAAKK